MPIEQPRELATDRRFEFGANWWKFLNEVNDSRIERATDSLRRMLGARDLRGKRFLDIGSGSGLFSLAAARLGASVYSFDYDPQSVSCTMEMKRRYYRDGGEWVIERGSVLDKDFMSSLGTFDIVYSWGVLHHTGNMWQAMEYAAPRVADGGALFIAIYNDQGGASKRWLWVKRAYNRMPRNTKWIILWPATVRLLWWQTAKDLLAGHPLRQWADYKKSNVRGMSLWRDIVDWVGGLPFEVATPQAVFDFFRDRGFDLQELKTCNNLGCNEFVFRRKPACQ